MQVGDFPSTAQGLEALRVAPSDLANPDDWAGPYLNKDVPPDPWKQPYQYEYPGKYDESMPDIWSLGQDGQNGTEDDVTSWKKE
jgi:general secretion pathway protein G